MQIKIMATLSYLKLDGSTSKHTNLIFSVFEKSMHKEIKWDLKRTTTNICMRKATKFS